MAGIGNYEADRLDAALAGMDDGRGAEAQVSARFVRTDTDGTTWVRFEGADKDTPLTSPMAVRAVEGDLIDVTLGGYEATGGGNRTDPSAGFQDVRAVNVEVERVKGAQAEFEKVTTKELEAEKARLGEVEADTAKIHDLTADQLQAATAYIASLTAGNITAQSLIADVGKVHNLTAEQLSAAAAYIASLTAGSVTAQQIIAINGDFATVKANAAKVANLTAAELEADHAKVGTLDSDYAQIDLANVNNAYIKNGAFDKAAVFDAAVFDLTGDTATIKEINADDITVRNLHTKNLTVDTADGYVTIGSKKTPTKEFIDSLKDELQQEIDGAVETFTADHVPLLNNYPANQWADDKTRAKHVGDICYVQKTGDEHDGFCYRFSYDSTSQQFSWVLIKDSSVTKALGDISDLKTFQSETSQWIEETDDGLTTIRENHTALSGVVDGVKATADAALPASTFTQFESTTFKTVKDTVDSQSTKFEQLTTTLGTNADGTSKANDIVHRTSAIEQDVSGFKQTVSETYSTKTELADALSTQGYTVEIAATATDTASGAVTLTATVRKDGTALTAAEVLRVGCVKWYRADTGALVGVGLTLSATSGVRYLARLEG